MSSQGGSPPVSQELRCWVGPHSWPKLDEPPGLCTTAVTSHWIPIALEGGHNFNSLHPVSPVSALPGALVKQDSPEVPVFIYDLY